MLIAGLSIVLAGSSASAGDANVESVLVIGTAPADVQTVEPIDITASHAGSVADILNENVSSVFLSDTESNPFQEDVYFRGFDASPVLGTAQGLAVYQGGTRINQRFGDTILWDLVPTFAIENIDVVPGSDPVFGLNALGGAVVINMKSGFDASPSVQLDAAGGSFGRAKLAAEAADQFGDEAIYVGASVIDDPGWRRSSASRVYQAYGDFSVRTQRASAGISLTLAADSLNENGAVPVQDSPTAAFAIPDTARNQIFFLQGRGEYDFAADLVMRGTIYLRATQIRSANGQASGFVPCTSDPAVLCDRDGNLLETTSGLPISSTVGGNGTDGLETISTTALGASIEVDQTGTFAGYNNSLILGNTLDFAYTGFGSATLLGKLTFQPGGTTTEPLAIYLGGPQRNVRLGTVDFDEGLYAQDTLALTSALSLELSGRFHLDRIDLTDRLGTALTGHHQYVGFNPAVEIVWRAGDGLTTYAEFEQSSRTPTAAELSCSNPTQPCLFPLSFISDPSLRQVIARTVEIGARGVASIDDLAFGWSADAYGTRNQDDIIFESSGPVTGSGFFANVGATQRIGAEVSADAKWEKFEFRASYAFVNATFESAFADLSGNNPGADANGIIFVKPGDRMPNIPRSSAKFTVGYAVTPKLHVSVGALLESVQYLRGDEANLQRPLPGYVVFNVEAEYQLAAGLQLYVEGENILDRHYATFGLYGDPTGGGAFPQFTNPRFIVPAQPFGLWAGVRTEF